MQTLENPIVLLRQLKGSPLSSLLALAIVRQPVNQVWIESVTGYDADTVRKGLRVLTEFGYAVRMAGQSWQIAISIQLPLMNDENYEKPRISAFAPTTTTLNASIMPVKVNVVEEDKKAEKIGVLNSTIYELLKHAGVGEPVRSELARNKNLTEKYVKSHIDKMRKERKPTAILIHRLRCEDEIIEEDDPDNYRRYLK